MFKHKAIVAAVLAVAAFSAQAASQVTQDPWVFYAPNPVADPVPTPPDFKSSVVYPDTGLFYGPNPVANPVPTPPDFKSAVVYPDTSDFYAHMPSPVATPRVSKRS